MLHSNNFEFTNYFMNKNEIFTLNKNPTPIIGFITHLGKVKQPTITTITIHNHHNN